MADQIALSAAVPPLAYQLSGNSHLSQNQSIIGWFTGDPASSGLDPARKAFENAVNEFRREIPKKECSKWLDSKTTISDVEDAVVSAKQKYNKISAKSRTRK